MTSALARGQLHRAADAVVTAIHTLQSAQETPWQSVAADVMREELYASIQLLRGVGDAIADALDDLAAVDVELTQLDVTRLDMSSLECSA